MNKATPSRILVPHTFTASQAACPEDDSRLWIVQHRKRIIHGLDVSMDITMRDTRCMHEGCRLGHLRYRSSEESVLALSGMSFGLDVVVAVGSMRLREDMSFPKIHRRLVERGVPISAMAVQYVFRAYLALSSCVAGLQDKHLLGQLRRQGGIVPVIDGVQFGEGEPVLYLIIDALSRQPLFGKEFMARSASDLVPFIAQLNTIGVPLIAVVSDKEKALLPSIAEALPGVKHQLCQLHYLKNVGKPMDEELKALGTEVGRTEEELRHYQRKLLRKAAQAEQQNAAPPPDLGVSLELTEAARAEARRSARAPFNPPALRRHEGLETVRASVHEARQKKGGLGTTSASLSGSSRPHPRAACRPSASAPVSA